MFNSEKVEMERWVSTCTISQGCGWRQPPLHAGPVSIKSCGGIHSFQDALQSGKVHWLREVQVESRIVSALLIGGGKVGAHGDRGQIRVRRLGSLLMQR